VSAAGTSKTPRPPVLIERFVKQLNITSKAVRLYPGASAIPRDNAVVAVGILHQVLERQPVVLLSVTREGLFYDGAPIFAETGAFAAFAREFYARHLSEVRFHAGTTADEVVAFLGIIEMPPEAIAAAGGFASELWERGVSAVSVAEVSTRIVDADVVGGEDAPAEPEDGEPWPPSPERVDELIQGAAAGRPRDRRLLVRAVSHEAVLRAFLRESRTTRGVAPTQAELTGRVGALAHCIQFELPEEREALLRSVAEAVLGLDPSMRHELLSKRLLSEAKRDAAVAAVVRQMSLDEVMASILEDIPGTPEARSGLSRAIRNLALISVSTTRGDVLGAAAAAMRAKGMSESDVDEVLDAATPRRLEMRERVRSSGPQPVDSVLRLLELTPGTPPTHAYEDGAAALRAEAARGLTDGDVLSALVTIATLETREDDLNAIVSLLEESIGLLIDAQEFEVAADAAEALTVAAADPGLSAEHRRRMGELVRVLARSESMRRITTAMRVYRHDSVEHAACRRLLSVLGNQTIAPLLEVLADEPDMAARKAMVDLVSTLARDSVSELGHRVADRRWYFVRNVVAILGGTHDVQALPFLERTLRHSDHRVRRETIRAAASIRDAHSDEMLMAALGDEDAANVQLAARYLGLLKVAGAVAALERVVRAEGAGNRENAPRIEAIEALGRIGAPGSARVLEDIERQRGLLAGRTREIRAAATAALGALRAKAGGGGAR
jgi:hypothetical protein